MTKELLTPDYIFVVIKVSIQTLPSQQGQMIVQRGKKHFRLGRWNRLCYLG